MFGQMSVVLLNTHLNLFSIHFYILEWLSGLMSNSVFFFFQMKWLMRYLLIYDIAVLRVT